MTDLDEDAVRKAATVFAQVTKPKPIGSQPDQLTVDDTLGRILRRAEPWVYRYTRFFGGLGLFFLPIRVFMLYAAAGGLLKMPAWVAAHDPAWIFKFMGALAALAFLVLCVVALYEDAKRRRGLKRRSKTLEAGIVAGFILQTYCLSAQFLPNFANLSPAQQIVTESLETRAVHSFRPGSCHLIPPCPDSSNPVSPHTQRAHARASGADGQTSG